MIDAYKSRVNTCRALLSLAKSLPVEVIKMNDISVDKSVQGNQGNHFPRIAGFQLIVCCIDFKSETVSMMS